MNVFYVYEHWRPDKNICFYVGKGKNKRAWDMKNMRNPHFKSVVSKLLSIGLCVDVRIIAKELTNEEAIDLEKKTIAFYGVKNLTNLTEGGDGMANPTEETRNKISKSQKLRFSRPEEYEKMLARLKNRIVSEDTKIKLSIAGKGRKHTEESIEKMKNSAKNRTIPLHVREAQKKAVTGKKRKPFSLETIKKMKIAAKKREQIKREQRAA